MASRNCAISSLHRICWEFPRLLKELKYVVFAGEKEKGAKEGEFEKNFLSETTIGVIH